MDQPTQPGEVDNPMPNPVVPSTPFAPKLPVILLIVLIIIAGGTGMYILATRKTQSPTPPLPTPTPSVTQISPTSAIKSIVDWKTYTSDALHIKFQYPPDFRVSENYNKASGLYGEGIFVDLNQTGGIPERWMKITSSEKSDYWNDNRVSQFYTTAVGQEYNKDNKDFSGIFTRVQDREINGKPAWLFEGRDIWETPSPLQRIFIKNGNIFYIIDITYSNTKPKNIDYIKAFDQILSTFRFTNQNAISPTASLQTYTNTQYGFSFRYPTILELKSSEEVTKNGGFDYIPLCSETALVTCLYLPSGTASDTTNNDFTGASLAVGTIDASQQDCLDYKDNARLQQYHLWPITQKEINGIQFSTVTMDGAAAGHQSTDTSYRTFTKNTCFDMTVQVNTESASTNTPEGQAGKIKPFSQVNRQNVETIFNQILATFRFD